MTTATSERVKRRRKRLGAYYTPRDLSRVLSEWSIRQADEQILEPSFGGCEILVAAHQRLQSLGAKRIMSQLYGCDIDSLAFTALRERFPSVHLNGQYLKKDFLATTPQDFRVDGFDVVLGNPPYVAHHTMSDAQIDAGQLASQKNGNQQIPKRASLWAYFVMHAVSFLRTGGRSAWVLPSSFMYANYATPVRDFLSGWFEHITAFRLAERMFIDDNVSEQSIVLLCDGKRPVASDAVEIGVVSVDGIQQLSAAIAPARTDSRKKKFHERYVIDTLVKDGHDLIESIEALLPVSRLGDLVDVRIGLVTGANRFFILNRSTASAAKLPRGAFIPIITSSRNLIGLTAKQSDIGQAERRDDRCLLLNTGPTAKTPKAVTNYLRRFPLKLRKRNNTFSKRSPWHQVNDGRIPDAFFSYMTHRGPKMAINFARSNCVNSVHRVFKKPILGDSDLKLLAISIGSTFTQLSAELCGRSYGDGVLKLELGELRKIAVIQPKNVTVEVITAMFAKIDKLKREGNDSEASRVTDEFLMKNLKSIDRQTYLRKLDAMLTAVRATRLHRHSN